MNVDNSVKYVKGVGPKSSEELNKIGIFTVLDLLLYFPRDYEHIGFVSNLSQCKNDEKIYIYGNVAKINRDIRTRTGKIMSSIIFESNGEKFKGIWFNQPYVKNSFSIGRTYLISGKCKIEGKNIFIQNPRLIRNSSQDSEKIVAKYPLKGKITNNFLNKIITNLLCDFKVEENLPKELIEKYKLIDLNNALRYIHCPDSFEHLQQARHRLKFQELFTYSLKVLSLKERYKSGEGISIPISKELKVLKEKIPFQLTNAQSRVIREIIVDQNKKVPMNRLVQGDVGSGKTVIAIIAMFNVVMNGHQALMMAPTEILAKQHLKEISMLLKDFNLNVELLVGSTTPKNKERIKSQLKAGEIDIVVGTHALIEDDVEFKNLGLIITDEQHRFGVNQRCRLSNKSKSADMLVMTATPIPRTLSLCFYGDLDKSIIDELPPNRKSVETYYISKNEKDRVYNFALKEINNGRQVYIVCPLVEEVEDMNLSSVTTLYEEIKKKYFKDIEVRILHGKMNAKEKETIMDEFKKGIVKVLVSTTVIEVGVNVPNATLMIIENAERFGLSQLHQLRGRVGRGEHKSYCVLVANIKSEKTRKRMEIMQNTNNGFILAEEDLKLRGTGELFGYKQHGENELIISDPIEDVKVLQVANEEAKKILVSEDEKYNSFKNYIDEYIKKSSNYICFN
ncbi:ATP-dependent DNA helicase RecG [Hathewaya limosa]|uniref:ATP-dependent DNA helicase RecG n=1 Tax=Hathewaya limosa TaxID=1536 RepID=A0ABU0JSE5_HATLI|nr:ATP-dependent DNA helicase RecG [Hathewaya limosa]MDQ0479004.1 ATP-dependent DNA helicase RecG [Hathewaya limosa]